MKWLVALVAEDGWKKYMIHVASIMFKRRFVVEQP